MEIHWLEIAAGIGCGLGIVSFIWLLLLSRDVNEIEINYLQWWALHQLEDGQRELYGRLHERLLEVERESKRALRLPRITVRW